MGPNGPIFFLKKSHSRFFYVVGIAYIYIVIVKQIKHKQYELFRNR